MVDTQPRLDKLRQLMTREKIGAYIIPSDDSHSSEYVADGDKRREFISGFDGSAGTAIVLEKDAHLFTDGRYHQQAEKQISKAWTLQKFGIPGILSYQEFLPTLSPTKIGLDPALFSIADYNNLDPKLKAVGSTLVPISSNLVDEIWPDKPARNANNVFVLETKYTGESAQDKIARVIKEIETGGSWSKDKPGNDGGVTVKGLVVSMLDELCWLLNLRGSDIPYNPVFFGYLYLPIPHSKESPAILFVNEKQLDAKTKEHLDSINVKIQPYDNLIDTLSEVGKRLQTNDRVIVPSTTNFAICRALSLDKIIVNRGPIGDLKAIKNEVEFEGFRQSHIRDGVALVRYFAYLQRELQKGTKITETEGATKLEEYRSQLDLFQGLSFDTISATGANGSIIHYKPDEVNSAVIKIEEMYLCDSGAQFLDGTTDTTRTLHFGTPTAEQKEAFTRVLQGHIGIDIVKFPSTTSGFQLDVLARRALWENGMDYGHGTGHGVGSFLNVHEGPHGIGTRISYNDVKLKKGMVVSNEPGYYKDGEWGIRIENVVGIVDETYDRPTHGGRKWYGMERFTMVPIQTSLIEPSLLSGQEIEWVNTYNAEVESKIGSLVEATGDVEAREWLKQQCKPISSRV